MDAQIEKAIEIAWDPRSDPNLKEQAVQYLTQVRGDTSSLQACLNLFTRAPKAAEVVRLVSLDIVNNAIQTQHIDDQSLRGLKEQLHDYVRRTYASGNEVDPPALQNKLTQTLTFLFSSLYKEGWESFIRDFLSFAGHQNGSVDNLSGVVLYLRLLSSIHDEIADLMIARAGEETKRNVELKDLVRARDVHTVAASFQQILTYWQGNNDAIVEMTLKVIGKWVSWIDISLVVNQDILNLLFPLVGRNPNGGEDKVKDAAIDCFTEIVAKKMKPSDKIGMILFLNLGEVVSQLISSPALHDLRNTSSYDTDLAEAVAKLVNNVVSDLVKILEDAKVEPDVRAQAEQLLQTFLPLLLRFFSDEYDEICATVIPSLTELNTFLRKAQPLPPAYSAMLTPILNAIIQKMRYDDTSSYADEDELTDEAEFQELRKRLQVLQKTIAAVDEALYVDVLSNVIGSTFQRLDEQNGQIDWRDLDLALHEMYLFGELTLVNGGLYAKSQPSSIAAERLIVMMSKMVESGIASFNHPAISLQYMEICVRYCSFFENQTQYIPQVLEQFVSFVHHSHSRVRIRSWYLFHRFVKHLRGQVGNVAETIIQSISDLLPLKAEVPRENDDDMSSDDGNHDAADVAFNAQLNLYEAIGCISSTTSTPIEKQAIYARTIMDPLFSDIERNLEQAKSGNAQATLQIHHIIFALGSLAHGFSDWSPGEGKRAGQAPVKEITIEFSRAAEAILFALEALKASFEVRNAARSSFSRLMGVMGVAMLPLLPRWIDGLLSQSSSKEEIAMFLRLLDQVVFGFKKDIHEVLNSLLTPLFQRVFASLSEPVTGTDDGIQLAELRREYLTFVTVILNNELGSVLVSEQNQAFFDPLIQSVTSLAKTVTNENGNLAASKIAFNVMTKMAEIWGGPTIATPGQPITSPVPSQPTFPGFDSFLIERFHPVCWEVLRDPNFRPLVDAQSKSVLNELAGLEQAIYMKTGNMFVEHLQGNFFPSMGVDGSGFIKSMVESPERKGLATFLQNWMKGKA
ncbi:Bclos1 [Botrytis cinerea B05.10]|uniref:Exportin-T n=3 Tax=Botryotinia fuckeliana TaxID=40559 RepID=XPOT_BOTFB|nr:Bclos1 [Botrytis cinerea B05.10]ATZ54227.1 Bclos1 [Botrytis cinerea B05.10]EMR85813.1 putative trna exportin protein [Botrytis cinerea BcDW1]CCD54169.1 similar to tRNA exportin [Botrytis cinerea T4]